MTAIGKKRIVWSLVILAVACGLSLLVLDDYYARSKPREQHPEVDQIYAHVAGFSPKATVYLTSKELSAFYLLLVMSIVSVLIVGALNQNWKVFRN